MKYTVIFATLLVLAGCAGEPRIQQGPGAEVTYDGLNRVDNSAFREAWADPDIDWSRYSKIMAGGAVFEFRAVKKTSGTQRQSSTQTEFWIDDSENRTNFRVEIEGVPEGNYSLRIGGQNVGTITI